MSKSIFKTIVFAILGAIAFFIFKYRKEIIEEYKSQISKKIV